MPVALVQVCVDERLNHELLRLQVQQRLAASYLKANRIFVLNELGGNLGQNFTNTAQLMLNSHENIVLAAILHHDDCKADQAGLRKPLDETLAQTARFLTGLKVNCLLVSGLIQTSNNVITWQGEQQIHPAD